jgi:putative ribosome biogenesis GTPase RsgA
MQRSPIAHLSGRSDGQTNARHPLGARNFWTYQLDCVCPFSVPAIRLLDELKLRSRVCLFAGENGTGKSTLLEAMLRITVSGGKVETGTLGTTARKVITQLTRW